MMVAALVPVVMLSLYLIIKNQGRSEQRVAFEQAVKNAALDTARKYIQNRTVAKQKDYLERIAAVSFNNSIKSAVGIIKNVIPLTLKVMTYLRCNWWYFNGGYDIFI